MIFITRRDTALRSMYEARDLGTLDAREHYDKIGALKELRSITQLPLKSAVELIDRVIAGEKIEIESLSSYERILELTRFVKVMDGHGFTISDDFVELDDTSYFVAVDEEPADDLRIEIERRILLIFRSNNKYNQQCGNPPYNLPNLVNMTDANLLDYYATVVARMSMPIG